MKAKVAKSAMAVANLPDEGAIVIGVKKIGEFYNPVGMEQSHIEPFKQDEVMEYINDKFVDPYIQMR